MKYYWKENGEIAFNSEAEMMAYYENSYKDAIESESITADECSLQDWMESDTEIVDEIYYEECIAEKRIRILMADRCTEAEAKKYLESGTEIYDETELMWMITNEMSDDRGFDDEDRQKYLDMIQNHIPLPDWSIVGFNDEVYYIAYVL